MCVQEIDESKVAIDMHDENFVSLRRLMFELQRSLKSAAINCKNSETPHKHKHKPDKGNQSIQCPIDDVGIGGRCGGAPRVISATFHVSWAKVEGASAAASGTRHE